MFTSNWNINEKDLLQRKKEKDHFDLEIIRNYGAINTNSKKNIN